MFKTNGVALYLRIGHLQSMLCCLRMATACFNVTTHGQLIPLIFLHIIPVVHVHYCNHKKPQDWTSPRIFG